MIFKFHGLASGLAGLLLTAAVLLSSACGGSNAAEEQAGGANSGAPANPATAERQGQPPRSQVELPPPALLTLPSDGANGLLGGAPDYVASDEAAAALRGSGLDLNGATILVLPVRGTEESILIIKFDEGSGLSTILESPEGPLPQMRALANVPALNASKVGRVVMVVGGSDKQGPYTATLSLPMTTLASMASGALSTKDAQKQLTFFIDRGVKP